MGALESDRRVRRRRGRPRSREVDEAILEATLDLLDDVGFNRLTIDGVARRAGVARTTVYRRWVDKRNLVLAALDWAHPPLQLPDTGSLHGDLEAMLRQQEELPTTRRLQQGLTLLATALADDEMRRLTWASLAEPRQAAFAELLLRAQRRGELRADLDIGLLTQVIAGSLFYQLLRPSDRPLPERMRQILALVSEPLTQTTTTTRAG